MENNISLKEKSDAEKNCQLVIKDIAALQMRLEENIAQNAGIKEQMRIAQVEIENARAEKKRVAMQVKAKMFELDEAQLAAQSIKTKLSGLESQIDKIEPINATLRRLRAHVEAKQSICLKGLLIDFIECTNP